MIGSSEPGGRQILLTEVLERQTSRGVFGTARIR